MKRTFLFTTLCLLLVCVVTFSACGGTVATETRRCWEQSEELTYTVTLADSTVKQDFGSYAYAKDVEVATENTDEVKPDDASGTLTVTYAKNGDNYVYTTEQTVYLGFSTEKFATIEKLQGIEDLLVDNVFQQNLHTVKCITKTSVTFNEKQLPISSQKEISGVYASKNGNSQVSKVKVSTTYNLDDYTATTTVNDGEAVTGKIDVKKGAKFIDANQITVYARSLKKDSPFQDVPTVNVYEPISGTVKTAYFTNFNAEERVFLPQNNNACVVLTSLGIYLGGTTAQNKLMFVASVPVQPSDAYLDVVPLGSESIAKVSQVKFTSGYLSYELDFDCLPDGANVLTAVTAK